MVTRRFRARDDSAGASLASAADDATALGVAAGGLGRSTALNLAGALIPLGVALVTVPLYLDVIGTARYGVLSIAWLFLAYFGVFNLGLGRAAGNQIARLRHASLRERQRVFWTALALNSALGVTGGLCLLVIGRLVVGHVFALPPDLRSETVEGLPWLALGVPFLTVSMVCVGVLEGLERFGAVNVLEILAVAVYQVGPLILAYTTTTSLTWLLALAATAPAVSALLAGGACIALLPVRGRPAVDRRLVRTLLSYGGWVSVTGLIGPLLIMLDRFVIAAVSGPRAVTTYTVPFSLVSRLLLLPMSAARALFPRMSFLADSDARSIAHAATAGLTALSTPLVVLAMALTEPFLRLWVGDEVADPGGRVGQIILVGVWLNMLTIVTFTLLQARGRPDLPAKVQLVELPLYLVALWIALSAGGIAGAAAVWTARVAVDVVALGVASRLYRRRELMLGVPFAIVLLSYLAAEATSPTGLARAAFAALLLLLALVWAWRTAPRGLRILLSSTADEAMPP